MPKQQNIGKTRVTWPSAVLSPVNVKNSTRARSVGFSQCFYCCGIVTGLLGLMLLRVTLTLAPISLLMYLTKGYPNPNSNLTSNISINIARCQSNRTLEKTQLTRASTVLYVYLVLRVLIYACESCNRDSVPMLCQEAEPLPYELP